MKSWWLLTDYLLHKIPRKSSTTWSHVSNKFLRRNYAVLTWRRKKKTREYWLQRFTQQWFSKTLETRLVVHNLRSRVLYEYYIKYVLVCNKSRHLLLLFFFCCCLALTGCMTWHAHVARRTAELSCKQQQFPQNSITTLTHTDSKIVTLASSKNTHTHTHT